MSQSPAACERLPLAFSKKDGKALEQRLDLFELIYSELLYRCGKEEVRWRKAALYAMHCVTDGAIALPGGSSSKEEG